MLEPSTIQLLRFHFSLFLMPVYWFALSLCPNIQLNDALLIGFILHVLVYPASNGYNSYMDRDTGSIGGIEHPLPPSKQLYFVTLAMDLMAVLLSLWISTIFATGILLYILASRAYSYRGIRIKKYPIWGFLLVMILQGAVTFFLVLHGASADKTMSIPWQGMAAASLLIGSFYPLSQIYQHQQDREDGVTTISYLLGYRATFYFSALLFAAANLLLWILLSNQGKVSGFFILQLFLLPVTVYFLWWFFKVFRNIKAASYRNTLYMNIIASICCNAGFIFLLINTNSE
jgi:1,4-dihydroxy-2-naphthoate octaprenyltransferase